MAIDVLQRVRALRGRGDLRTASHENADDARQRLGELVAMHDHVDHAVGEEVLRALEALRQLLADRLLDDARSGKADERTRLRNLDIAEHGIGRGDAARRRIRQHDDVGQTCLAQLLDRNGRPRHLHERENALLHTRAARRREQDEGLALGHRVHHARDNGFAGGHAQRSTHETKILRRGGNRLPTELAIGEEHGILEACRGLAVLEAIRIAAPVAELERIDRHVRRGQARIVAAIEDILQALVRRHAIVMTAAGEDELRLLERPAVGHLPATGALLPKVIRRLTTGREQAPNLRTDDVVDPVHASVPLPQFALTRSY